VEKKMDLFKHPLFQILLFLAFFCPTLNAKGYLLTDTQNNVFHPVKEWKSLFLHPKDMDPFYVQFPEKPETQMTEKSLFYFFTQDKSVLTLSFPSQLPPLPSGERTALHFIFRELKREGIAAGITLSAPKIENAVEKAKVDTLFFTYQDKKNFGTGRGKIVLSGKKFIVLIATGKEENSSYFLKSLSLVK
jgi:hypothetical protein